MGELQAKKFGFKFVERFSKNKILRKSFLSLSSIQKEVVFLDFERTDLEQFLSNN